MMMKITHLCGCEGTEGDGWLACIARVQVGILRGYCGQVLCSQVMVMMKEGGDEETSGSDMRHYPRKRIMNESFIY